MVILTRNDAAAAGAGLQLKVGQMSLQLFSNEDQKLKVTTATPECRFSRRSFDRFC